MSILYYLYTGTRIMMWVASIPTNLFTLVCVLRKRYLRSSANLLVASLALSDFLHGVSMITLALLGYFFATSWHVYHALCLTRISIEGTTICCQYVTFSMLALERRNSLLFRLNRSKKWSCRTVVIILLSLWAMIAVYMISVTISVSDVAEGTICFVTNYYPNFFIYIGVIAFAATCIVTTAGYGHIAWVAYKSHRQVTTTQPLSQQMRLKKDMAITKMMAMVVGVFFALYSPMVVSNAFLSPTSPKWQRTLHLVTVLIYDIIFWINPFIYAWRDKGFRKAFTESLPLCCGRCCSLLGGEESAVTPSPVGLQVVAVGAAPVGPSPPGNATMRHLVPRDP